MIRLTQRTRNRASTLAALLLVYGLSGCAAESSIPQADQPSETIQCGSTNLYEPHPDAGFTTVADALEERIAWLAETGVNDPPSDGASTLSLSPELHTMEVALAAFEAGRHVETVEFDESEIVTIHAIDASGEDTGEVKVEKLRNGYYVSVATVRTGTADTLDECP